MSQSGEELDIRQADLWSCRECDAAFVNRALRRTCSHCDADLEYLGEIDYENKTLS